MLTAPREVSIVDVAEPFPAAGEVLVRVTAVGVCGSDVHFYHQGHVGSASAAYPMGLGHEPAGIVVGVGEGVSGLAEGVLVALEPGIPCGRCEPCAKGKPNLCPHVRFLAQPDTVGAFQEYLVMPEENCLPAPAGVSAEACAVAEPLGVGLEALAISGIRAGETAAVFGCGPIGLSTIAALRSAGVEEIIASEPLEARRAFAARIGASHAIDPEREDVIHAIRELTKGRGVDVAFEAAGEQLTIDQTIEAAAIAGTAVIIGIPREKKVEIDIHTARRKELPLRQVRRSNLRTAAALELLARKDIPIEDMVTHRFPLSETAKAMDLVRRYADGVIKAVVVPGGSPG
jgi:L-iditol 2-dehydrogenase